MHPVSVVEMALVRTMAHALRHDPTKYDLEPDPEGWVSLDDLIIAIRFDCYEWADLARSDIVALLAATKSDRFEIAGPRIRAVYGHSIALEKPPAIGEPPEFLFHGTAAKSIPEIMSKGLNPMGRQFVHLSSDIDWVLDFVLSKPQWALLRILARQACRDGVCFRRANRHVWLADSMIAQFIRIESAGAGGNRLH